MYSDKLKGVLAQIKKKQGNDVIIDLVGNEKREYPSLCSTGSLGLDQALGGAAPKGKILELYGPESSGKTTVALQIIANVQKMGKVAAYLDIEQSFDPTYAKALGVNLDELIFIQTDSAEKYLDAYEELAHSGEIAVLVLDSTNALVPQVELDGDPGDLKVGLIARLLSQHLRKITSAKQNGVLLIYISQLREKIGIAFGDPRVIGVGNAMKFYADQRVEFTKSTKIENDKKEYIGTVTKAVVRKNKLAPPFKEAIYNLIYGKGIDQESELIQAAIDLEILERRGSGIHYKVDTVFWEKEQCIDTTIEKVQIKFKEEGFYRPIYLQIKGAVFEKLGQELTSKETEELSLQYETYQNAWITFQNLMTEGKVASGESKPELAMQRFCGALEIFPWHKEAQNWKSKIEKRLKT